MSISALRTPNIRSHVMNPVMFTLHESTGTAVKLVIEVFVEEVFDSNHFSPAGSFVEYLDSDENATFDIAEILRAYVTPAVFVAGEDNSPAEQVSGVCRWNIEVSSRDADNAELDTYELEDQLVYYGGIVWEQWQDAHFFADWLPVNKSFLTWQPNNQKVDLTTNSWVTWLALEEVVGAFKLFVKIYFETGDPEIITDGAAYEPNYQFSPFTFPCGYTNLGLAAHDSDGNKIVKYDVWVQRAGIDEDFDTVDDEVMTEVRTYIIDRTYYRNKKKFAWSNTIGGIDSMLCTGNYINEYEYTGDEAIIYVAPNYHAIDGQREAFDNEEQGRFTASTGWKTKKEIDHFRDALLSLKVTEDDGVQFLPIAIERDTIRTFESNQKMFALQFVYKPLFKNKVYTGPGYDNTVRA